MASLEMPSSRTMAALMINFSHPWYPQYAVDHFQNVTRNCKHRDHCKTGKMASYSPPWNWHACCKFPLQILGWSVSTVSHAGEKPTNNNFLNQIFKCGAPVPTPSQITAILGMRQWTKSTLPCQISPWIVNTATHMGPKQQTCNCRGTDHGQIWHATVEPSSMFTCQFHLNLNILSPMRAQKSPILSYFQLHSVVVLSSDI